MGPRRPLRRLAPAVLVVAGTLFFALGGEAGSQPKPLPDLLYGSVGAGGATGESWRAEHPEPGVYRIAIQADVDVQDWDGAARVTVVPLGAGQTEVRFALDGIPTDTAFTFRASPR